MEITLDFFTRMVYIIGRTIKQVFNRLRKRVFIMKKTYNIEVDCANCANKMEAAANKIDGVASATVNFMMQKMIIDFSDGSNEKRVMKNILKACKKIEPDCEIEF